MPFRGHEPVAMPDARKRQSTDSRLNRPASRCVTIPAGNIDNQSTATGRHTEPLLE